MAESTHRRVLLPAPSTTKKDSNLFSILKNSMGKDLSSIPMPVEFNEPLSFLQRISEYMEYAPALLGAADSEHTTPQRRIQLVSAFAVSALASNWERLRKPFNPLLGETYELCTSEFRLVCEQVSHHPPVSAFHAESEAFDFFGDIHPRIRFWGKSLEIKPEGTLTVRLKRHNEVYSWSNVHCCVHNIVIGKLWFEQYGLMEIQCPTNGLSTQLHFKPAGWFGKDLHRVEGFVIDTRTKQRLCFLFGRWTEHLDAASIKDYEEALPSGEEEQGSKKSSKLHVFTRSMTGGSKSPEPPVSPHDEPPSAGSSLHIPNSTRLWQAHDRPHHSQQYYNFTSFAMALNELLPGSGGLPRTDSRLRPDIRKMEEGDMEGAAAEKSRLEERQREARKERKKRKETWNARWFRQPEKSDSWVFGGEYWKRNFDACPHIF